VVLAFPALACALFFLLPLLVDGHFMTDDAARGRSGQGVVVGVVTRNAADDRTSDAAGLGLARHDGGGDRTEQKS
jgi:hypothetical protein